MNDAIRDLVEISRYAARRPDFVQGGGGNCSVKRGGKMLIKASGFRLDEVSLEKGFVIVDLPAQTAEGGLRPSMETGLHAMLGPCVIHTHPILAGALVCSQEGSSQFTGLFPEKNFFWINYARPGRNLAEKVSQRLCPGRGEGALALFLQNHGLFVSAGDPRTAICIHEDVLRRLADFFGSPGTVHGLPVAADAYLTPDHAVYARQEESEELKVFAQKVAGLVRRKGWHLNFLDPAEVRALLGMEQEKYRLQVPKEPG